MKKLGIFVMPLMIVSLLASCGGKTAKTYTITWINYDGSELEVDYDVPYGTIPSYDHETPNKPSTPQYTYTFSGWDGDVTKGIVSDTIFKAQYKETINKFTVTFVSDGGQGIPPQTGIEYNGHASNPGKLGRAPTKKFEYNFDGWHKIKPDGEMEEKTFNFDETAIVENITLKAKWIETVRTYVANVGDNVEHLKFTKSGKKIEDVNITAGQPFSFEVEIDDSSNSAVYKIPTELNIKIRNNQLLNGYKIDPNAERTKATVTIEGEKVLGDITIEGIAAKEGTYSFYMPYHYGVEGIEPEEVSFDSDLVIEFQPIEKTENDTYQYPGPENIYVKFDGVEGDEPIQWVSPAEESVEKYCEYDKDKGKLTIHPTYVDSNVAIVARAADYPLLDKMTWDEIDDMSNLDLAEYVFNLGEEKHITINKQTHRVRIIDFNHDDLSDESGKASITFEFANLISDENGYSLASLWQDAALPSGASFDYLNSTIRKNLVGDGHGTIMWYEKGGATRSSRKQAVIDMLPSDLRSVLKIAKKKVNLRTTGSWVETDVCDALFLLGANEMNEKTDQAEKGEAYEYYKNAGFSRSDAIRIKQQVNGTDKATTSPMVVRDTAMGISHSYAGYNSKDTGCGAPLWLRSPFAAGDAITSWGVSENGDVPTFSVYAYAFGVAPAFCI